MIDYINKDYYRAVKEAVEQDQRVHKTPVTKREQEAREADRHNPAMERHFTPDGSVVQTVNLKVEAENEKRINFIKKRLERKKNLARRDFQRAR